MSPETAKSSVVELRFADTEQGGPASPDVFGALDAARWSLAGVTLIAMLLTFAVSRFVLTPVYRADAVLRPVSPDPTHLSTLASGGFLAGLGAAAMGLQPSDQAEEYMSIMKSYAFTMEVAAALQLEPDPVDTFPSLYSRIMSSENSVDPKWQLYRRISKRFTCDYDRFAGNMTAHFFSPSRADAIHILDTYINVLREKVRVREIQTATKAAAVLEEEALHSSDPLLRSQLYEDVARQLQREKLAQVQADFAFAVIEPPVAADSPYRPRPLFYTALCGLMTLTVLVVLVVLNDQNMLGGRRWVWRPNVKRI